VDTKHKNGTYHSNPLAFYRSWEFDKASEDLNQAPENVSNVGIQRLMDERFQKLENTIANLLESQNRPVKHVGRGKKSKNLLNRESEDVSNPVPGTSRGRNATRGTSQGRSSRGSRGSIKSSSTGSRNPRLTREAISRLDNYIGNNPNDLNSDLFTEDLQSELTDDPIPVKKTIFIQKVDCQFNGNSIDSIEDKASVDQAMQQFWRMYYFNGQLNSLFSNGLTYSDFLKGYFFCVYDFSTSNKAGSSYLIPAIRVGHLRMRYKIFIWFKYK
jgi:hypothetical protein